MPHLHGPSLGILQAGFWAALSRPLLAFARMNAMQGQPLAHHA